MKRAPRTAPPAVLFFGVITASEPLLVEVRALIVRRYGRLHRLGESPVYPFCRTRTYERSMGTSLLRKFFALDALWPQDALAAVKHDALRMEEEIRARYPPPPARPVNIDPGLLNDCRIILASTKDYAHRLYRGNGIWEEITLVFQGGDYRSHPWTYRDFGSGAYNDFFKTLRRDLLQRTKQGRGRQDPQEAGGRDAT